MVLLIIKVIILLLIKFIVCYVGLFYDIIICKNIECSMFKFIIKDIVIGLLNCVIFIEFFDKVIKVCNDIYLSLFIVFIDIDNFKKINDFLGYILGDVLFKEVVCCLIVLFNLGFIIVRLGVDEFVIFVFLYFYLGKMIFFVK